MRSSARGGVAIAVCLLVLVFLAPAAASAKEVRLPKASIGSFVEPRGLAVEQSTGDVYATDARNERQSIAVSATAGKFKLKFEGRERELAFNASKEAVATALNELVACASACVTVFSGKGDASGSEPYEVLFAGGPVLSTDVPQLVCENGTPALTGGSHSCTVTTTVNGVNGQIVRYHANGTPAPFSALGSNVIDGRGTGDETPQGGLHFSIRAKEAQIAIDESGGETDGDIYVTQVKSDSVDIFSSAGAYLGQLTQYETTPGSPGTLSPLLEPCGVAVDPAGNLFIGDFSAKLHEYTPSTNPVSNTDNSANPAFSEACNLALGAGPTAGSLFAQRFNGALFKLSTAGELKYEVSNLNTTLAVDPGSGHLLTATGSAVREYDASGASSATELHSLPAGSEVQGIAAEGSSGNLYLSRVGDSHLDVYSPWVVVPDVATEAATAIGPATATLHAAISAAGGPNATCSFQYLPRATYESQRAAAEIEGKNTFEVAEAAFAGAQTKPCQPAGPFTGSGSSQVSSEAGPLAHETAYAFRVVGENEHTSHPADDPGAALFFSTFGKPQVKGGTATAITETEAQIEGEVASGGQPSTFAVQYVTQSDFEASGYNKAKSSPEVPEAIGSGTAFAPHSAQLGGLAPETAYRFRIVAANPDGMVFGPEGTFSTFGEPSGLLDDRAYELVSPAGSKGEVFPPERSSFTGTCNACLPGWNTQRFAMQASPDGEAVGYEGSAFEAGLASGANEYVSRRGSKSWQTTALSTPAFNDEEPEGVKALSPDLSKSIYYQSAPALSPAAPQGYADLYLREEGKAGLTPLNATKPPARIAGTKGTNVFEITYAGANAGASPAQAFSHVVFQANDALTGAVAGTAPAAPAVGGAETDLYEWSGGSLRLVNVLPGNVAAVKNAVIGSGLLLTVSTETPDFDHAISTDGSRIFWSAVATGQVYVREGGTSTTELTDHAGKFLTATPSGSKALLSDGCLYSLAAGGCEADLTLDESAVHRGGFQGIAGASTDLSRVYFVDTAVLAANEGAAIEPVSHEPEEAEAGKPNLYLWEAGGGTRFIGRLLGTDNSFGVNQLGSWRASPGSRLAQATPDGGFLAFASQAPLTGYDSSRRNGRECENQLPRCKEVFEYDAATNTLRCPSCNPSGEHPLGPSNLSLIFANFEAFPAPHNLPPKGEGRLFFESQDTLTLGDRNGHIQDVYEWEPEGVGSCAKAKGCLSLISSGQSPNDSQFLDASETGSDAFFTTRSALVPADSGDDMDLYDARVNGGIEEEAPPTPCEGEACRGAVSSPPSLPGAASAIFVGPGNPPAERRPSCRRGFVKRRGACVKPHKHKPRKHRNRRRPRR